MNYSRGSYILTTILPCSFSPPRCASAHVATQQKSSPSIWGGLWNSKSKQFCWQSSAPTCCLVGMGHDARPTSRRHKLPLCGKARPMAWVRSGPAACAQAFQRESSGETQTCGALLPSEVVCPDYRASQALPTQTRRRSDTPCDSQQCHNTAIVTQPSSPIGCSLHAAWRYIIQWFSPRATSSSALCTKSHYPWGHSSLLWIGKRKEDDKE